MPFSQAAIPAFQINGTYCGSTQVAFARRHAADTSADTSALAFGVGGSLWRRRESAAVSSRKVTALARDEPVEPMPLGQVKKQ